MDISQATSGQFKAKTVYANQAAFPASGSPTVNIYGTGASAGNASFSGAVSASQLTLSATGTFNQTDAPIIFTLFVSMPKNIVHAVKVTNIRPDLIKKFFGKFVNEENDLLEIKGGSKQVYQNIVSKVPIVTDEAYRTYLLDGLEDIVELDFDITGVTPTERKAKFINVKGKKRE